MMKTKILYTVLLVLAIFTFSCTNEPIFYNIAQEVPLLDSVVKGNVYSIVEQGEYLYAANGKIFRKGKTQEVTNNSNPWKLVDKPAGKIIRLAATDSYLYALSVADPINGSEKYTIYVSPASDKLSWEVVSVTGNVTAIFDNEAAPGTGKLQAYYSTKDGIFAINGKTVGTTNLKTETNFISTKKETNSEEEASFAVKAATVGDITVFSDDLSLCSDREKYFYKVDEKFIKYSTDGNKWEKVSLDISDSASACYYESEGNSWIYVGTAPYDGPGLQAINLNNGIPTAISEPVGKNIASCLDDTQVIGLYPFPYGSGNLYAASVMILSSTALSNDNQLWGFYPDRDSWNRE